MQTQKSLLLGKPLAGIALSLWAGVGISAFAIALPANAELDRTQVAQNSPQRNNRQPPRENLSFKMDGDKLQICRPQANSTKLECQVVGKGYAFILRTANDLYRQGNASNAESLFRQLIAEYPKQAEAYYKLGTLLAEQSKLSDAIAQFRQAITLNPQYAKARTDLGLALARQGQIDEAIGEWREALKINGEYAEAWNYLGIGLLQQGQKEHQEEAVSSLKKARELFIKQGKPQPVGRIDRILQEVQQESNRS